MEDGKLEIGPDSYQDCKLESWISDIEHWFLVVRISEYWNDGKIDNWKLDNWKLDIRN